MITITYFSDSQQYTIDYTIQQIKNELICYGVPNVNKMSEKELIESLKEIN
jgi:hypothetical protein